MVRKSVLRIGIDWVDGSAADDCDRLIALAQDSPREVLDGILEFLELPDIQKGGKPNDLPTSFIFNFDIIVFTSSCGWHYKRLLAKQTQLEEPASTRRL